MVKKVISWKTNTNLMIVNSYVRMMGLTSMIDSATSRPFMMTKKKISNSTVGGNPGYPKTCAFDRRPRCTYGPTGYTGRDGPTTGDDHA